MATMRTARIQVYPDPGALRDLGADVPGEVAGVLNRAVEVFAELIARSTRDNEALFSRQEWSYLASVMHGHAVTPGMDPHSQLVANVEDAHSLDNAGDEWFGAGEGSAKVVQLVEKIRTLDVIHAWAVIGAVGFSRGAKKTDEWWRLAFRRRAK